MGQWDSEASKVANTFVQNNTLGYHPQPDAQWNVSFTNPAGQANQPAATASQPASIWSGASGQNGSGNATANQFNGSGNNTAGRPNDSTTGYSPSNEGLGSAIGRSLMAIMSPGPMSIAAAVKAVSDFHDKSASEALGNPNATMGGTGYNSAGTVNSAGNLGNSDGGWGNGAGGFGTGPGSGGTGGDSGMGGSKANSSSGD